jgi:hypothetical protein
VRERLHAVERALGAQPRTVVEIVPEVYGEPLRSANAALLLTQTLCYLSHLENAGAVEKFSDGEVGRWRRL